MAIKHNHSVALLSFTAMILLSFAAKTANANDGTYYTKGNQLVPLMETDISVQKEELTISLMDNGYARVDVYYEFWNPRNETKRLLMGFEADPSYNDDYKFHPDGVHPNIHNFTVEMNGRTISYQNAPCLAGVVPINPIDTNKHYYIFDNNELYEIGSGPEYEDYSGVDKGLSFAYVYYFYADFQPGLNRIHHTYTYRMSVVVGIPYVLDYKLTPATRWANKQIDDFTLVIRVDSTAKHFFLSEEPFPGAEFTVLEGAGKVRHSKDYHTPVFECSLRNGAIALHLNNFKPQSELNMRAVGVYDCHDYENNVFHFGATYDRTLDISLWYDDSVDKIEPSDKAFRQRVARNLPFAHRGHVFRDAELRRFFESQWWYMPDPNYKDDTSDFTEVDWTFVNVKL